MTSEEILQEITKGAKRLNINLDLKLDESKLVKTGGYKISALEIEDALIKHPLIKECAVVGKKDKKWGEVVATAIVTDQKKLSLNEIQNWSLNLNGNMFKIALQMVKK